MNIAVDIGAAVAVALAVGGSLVALARQVSGLTTNVAMLCTALATERVERHAADEAESSRRERAVNRLHERLDTAFQSGVTP